MKFVISILALTLMAGCAQSPTSPTTGTWVNTMSGTWTGTLTDVRGTRAVTFALTQNGEALAGTLASGGTFDGLLGGSMVTFTIIQPGLCTVTLHGYAGASLETISGKYHGSDCAAGPVDGRLEIKKL